MVADHDTGRVELFKVLQAGNFKTHPDTFQVIKDAETAAAPIRVAVVIVSRTKAGPKDNR